MALKTQGTQFYFIDPEGTSGPEVVAIDCVISGDGPSAPRDQLESTCLESEARTYEPGMPTPGQLTLGLNFDPSENSHVRVYELWRAGTKVEIAIGLSDGTAAPTLDSADLFELPTTRSFFVLHDAFFADIPLSLALNALVTANVSVQTSGFPELFPKA